MRPSSINGVGVFALVDVAPGEIITREDDSYVVTPDNPIPDGEQEYHCDWYADGRQVFLPVPERHFNHSCDFNGLVRFIDGARHTVARRRISAGEEITHFYPIDGFGGIFWKCNCSSANCLKGIPSDFFRLPRQLQIEYLPYVSDLYRRVYREQVDALEKDADLA